MPGQDSASGVELWRMNIRRLIRAAAVSNGVGGLLVFLLLSSLIPFAPEGAQDDIPLNAAVGAAYLTVSLVLGARWGMRASAGRALARLGSAAHARGAQGRPQPALPLRRGQSVRRLPQPCR